MTHKSGIMEGRVVSKRTSDTQTLPLFFYRLKKLSSYRYLEKKLSLNIVILKKKSETRYRYKYRDKKMSVAVCIDYNTRLNY